MAPSPQNQLARALVLQLLSMMALAQQDLPCKLTGVASVQVSRDKTASHILWESGSKFWELNLHLLPSQPKLITGTRYVVEGVCSSATQRVAVTAITTPAGGVAAWAEPSITQSEGANPELDIEAAPLPRAAGAATKRAMHRALLRGGAGAGLPRRALSDDSDPKPAATKATQGTKVTGSSSSSGLGSSDNLDTGDDVIDGAVPVKPGSGRSIDGAQQVPTWERKMDAVLVPLDFCGGGNGFATSWLRAKAFEANAGGDMSLQKFWGLFTHDEQSFGPDSVIIPPGSIDIPCSGNGRKGAWNTRSCDIAELYGWGDYVVQALDDKYGISGDQYHHLIMLLPDDNPCPNGRSFGMQGCTLYPNIPHCYNWLNFGKIWDFTLIPHEVAGHNQGLYHSQLWGSRAEYGDNSCIMSTTASLICFNAAQQYRAGIADPIARVDSSVLRPGVWVQFTLPAVAVSEVNHVLIRPDWADDISRHELRDATMFLSYRAPVGCDEGLGNEFVGQVQLHSYVDRTGKNLGNDTMLHANVDLNEMWPKPGTRKLDTMSARLAIRQVSRSSYNLDVPTATAQVCMYDTLKEDDCNDGLDNDCDGLVDRDDPDC